jgi:hypothetical protein
MFSFVSLSIVMSVSFCVILLFLVLFLCKCVLYCCHRVSTQRQLNIIYLPCLEKSGHCEPQKITCSCSLLEQPTVKMPLIFDRTFFLLTLQSSSAQSFQYRPTPPPPKVSFSLSLCHTKFQKVVSIIIVRFQECKLLFFSSPCIWEVDA